MDLRLLLPVAIAALVLWIAYRRIRRNFGRQRVQPTRLGFRAALLTTLGIVLLSTSLRDGALFSALLAGLAAGVVLGLLGLRHTLFEVTPEGRYYTPHTLIGVLVTTLFVSRLLYRALTVSVDAHAAAQANQAPFAEYQKSPLTLAIIGVLIGYYVCFNLGVLRRSRPSPPSPPTVGGT